MKSNIYFVVLMLIGSLITSCETNDLGFENDFENSHDVWLNFKESANNSYKYKVIGSTWTGSSWETTLTVAHGIITQRYFKYTSTEGLADNVPEEDLKWTENENEIGSHKYTAAADALTLDEIYDKARQEWLVKGDNAKTYFEAGENGLISTCGYVDNGCADDCFVGIKIESIQAL